MSDKWTPEQFLDYLEALTDDFAILQIRETLTERGLCIAPAPQVPEPVAGSMRIDLMLEKIDGENAQNSEVFNEMRANIWAAGADHEEADLITRMLTRKGLYLFQTEPWKRCPSTHCERRAECSGPRDCTIKVPAPVQQSAASTDEPVADDSDHMVKISKLIGDLQSIKDRFGDTCVYIRRGGLSWGAVALNRRDDDKKHGVFELQAQHDRDMLQRLEQIERLKDSRNRAETEANRLRAALADPRNQGQGGGPRS